MSLKRVQDFKSMERSFVLFCNSNNSEATMELYRRELISFMDFVDYSDRYDDYIRLDSETIHRHLEDFLMFHNGRGIKGTTI